MSDYEKLNKLCNQIDELISLETDCYSEDFVVWQDKCRRFITKKYGETSAEAIGFNTINFESSYYETISDIHACRIGLVRAKGLLEDILDDMLENMPNNTPKNTNEDVQKKDSINTNKVFIVHGHDEALKYKVSNLIQQAGLEPIILHEQANVGKTIIEKIEHFGNDVGAAVILFTPDDTGKANIEPDYKKRARQNVVFEAGFFSGLLGRKRVIILISDGNIELPGDLSGIVYIDEAWQFKFLRELKEMGFNIDLNTISF